MTDENKCVRCHDVKPASDFGKDARHTGGLKSMCRQCESAYRREWRKEHPEKERAAKNEWRKAHPDKDAAQRLRYRDSHKDELVARGRRWQHANPEKVAAKSRRWRIANPARALEIELRWREAHPEQVAAKGRRRRARKSDATIEQFDEQGVWDYWGPQCAYCGTTEDELTLDHIVPLSQGGPHSFDNLCVACRSCNSSKGAKKLIEWMWWKARQSELAVMGVEQMSL